MEQKTFLEKATIEIFKQKLNSHELVWNKSDRMLHLFEEVGELSEIILQFNGRKKPAKTKEDIENAIADVIDDVFSLCILYNIDINKVITKVINEE
jgi:NTP pyrophosphatase (non-canonical NTP hydrolase)